MYELIVLCLFIQEKEKDEEFISQLQKEKESHEEQLGKLELEVCNKITVYHICYI